MGIALQLAGLALMAVVVAPCQDPAHGADEWIRVTVRAGVFVSGFLLWHAG